MNKYRSKLSNNRDYQKDYVSFKKDFDSIKKEID